MINSTDRKADAKAEREAQEKAKRRAEQAAVITGLQQIIEGDEQLLGFVRGRIAGGWRGKLNVGPEAFFAPIVNVGLTERRIILQHVHPETGKPSEILPHSFPVTEMAGLLFTDIETFGAEQAGRLIIRLNNEQHFRIRLQGVANVESAKTMTEVFQSLTTARRKSATTPTQSVCPHCAHILDQVSKFCPYCGGTLPTDQAANATASAEAEASASVTAETTVETVVETTFVDTTFAAPTPEFSGAPSPVEAVAQEAAASSAAPTSEFTGWSPSQPPTPPSPPTSAWEIPAPSPAPEATPVPFASETPASGFVEGDSPPVHEASTIVEDWGGLLPDDLEAATARYEQPTGGMLSDALATPPSEESAEAPQPDETTETPRSDAPHGDY